MVKPDFEIDHVMVCLSGPAVATKALVGFGLVAGHSGSQPGTGAAHTIFFFDNAYLELAWSESGDSANLLGPPER